MSPTLSVPVQGLCLAGALASCGFAISCSQRGIRPEAMQRVREGMNFEAMKQEMAVAASSMEQAIKARYFPREVEPPIPTHEELERAYAKSPSTFQVGPELVLAVRALREAGMVDEEIAIACLGGADAAQDIDAVLKIGEEQGW